MDHYSESKSPLRYVSADLLIVGLLGVYALGIAGDVVGDMPGRGLLGAGAVLFAPGYALVCGLFPREHTDAAVLRGLRATVSDEPGRITLVERLLLGVSMSLCLVPLLGLSLIFVGITVQMSNIVGAVGLTTVGLTVGAGIRRHQALPRERFDPKRSQLLRWSSARASGANLQEKLTILLIVGFVVAGAGISMAVLGADRGEQFTEFGLVTEASETGEVTADGYPDELTESQSERIQISITNNEGETIEYTVVTLVESLDLDGQRERAERVDSFRVSVQDGETVRQRRTISSTLTGDDRRLTYLLYLDTPPETETPSPESAYRTVHVWVDVPSGE